MKLLLLIVCASLALPSLTFAQGSIPLLSESKEAQEERIEWFRDAKFGLFIHWGPAAISGEEISWGMKDRIERGDRHKKVERAVYTRLYKGFNPVKFDADKLLSLADQAGMKYIVFVAKHHDGFAMWHTQETRFPGQGPLAAHYSIADSPYEKDICHDIATATRKHGLRLGWYYSTRDWTHPEYLKGDNKTYNDYYENQVDELMTRYGKVDLMWFDHCFGAWEQYTIPRLYEKMFSHNPQVIINNRAARGLPDIPAEYNALAHADFDTPENRMGAFQHGRAWESCMILSPHPDHGGWSYRPQGVTRSLTETIQLLSSCVTGDGNMLLNLAPLPDGSLKPQEQAILEGIAPWIKTYGEAIYETRGGPWISGPWGGATYKGNHVYLHLINPTGAPVELNRLPQNIIAATTVDGAPVPFEQLENTVSVTLPKNARDPHVSIIKLTLDAPVEGVLYGPALAGQAAARVAGTISFNPADAKTNVELTTTQEDQVRVIGPWKNPKQNATWPLEIDSPGKYKVMLTASCEKPGSVIAMGFGKNIKGIHGGVPVTGDHNNYQTFQLGEVYFPNAESTQLLLRPAHHHAWQPIKLKSIQLVPSN